MPKRLWMSAVTIIALVLLLVAMPLLSACGGEEPESTPTTTTVTEPEESEFDVVQAAVAAYLLNKAGNMKASDLHMKIAEGDAPYIVSVRSAENYAAGHIPGAINIGLSGLAENLDKLDPDAPVYVYCYTGHSSAQAVALLSMLGYDAYSVKFGMCSWTADTAVNAGKCFDATTVQGYEVEK